MTDREYMELALFEAEKAEREGEIPIGAVLVFRDTVLAAAHNRRETDYDPTAHAEILALRRGAERLGRWRLTECTLYVTIEPCAMCAGAVMNARISRLVYGCPCWRRGFPLPYLRRACHESRAGGSLRCPCRAVQGADGSVFPAEAHRN